MQLQSLKKKFDWAFTKYHQPHYLKMDPLCCVHSLEGKASQEIGGLVASVLAYGRVEIIIANVNRIYNVANNNLFQYVMKTSLREKISDFSGFKHRFNDGVDIAILLECIKLVYSSHGSIESFFTRSYHNSYETITKALCHFTKAMKDLASEISGTTRKSFAYLFPSPEQGSACKRLNMYLRWMVRESDGIDLGIWKGIKSSALMMPLDTHTAAVSRSLGLTRRVTADWKMVEDVTRNLRRIDPVDPIKYDFALCRAGMINFRE